MYQWMKRRALLALFGFLLVAITVGAIWMYVNFQVSSAYTQIQKGMTKLEVRQILGGPGRVDFFTVLLVPKEDTSIAEQEEWVTEEGTIHLAFDRGGTVVTKLLVPPQPRNRLSRFLWELRWKLPF